MEKCLINFKINDKTMTKWFYVMTLGDQNLILEQLKAFIRSLAQEQEKTMLIEDTDLVIWYLKSHRGPKLMDQLTSSFKDICRTSNVYICLPVYKRNQRLQSETGTLECSGGISPAMESFRNECEIMQ